MGLQDLQAPAVSDAAEKQIHSRWETIQRVLTRLAARGITIPEQSPPFPIPQVTTTLVSADNQEYLKINAQYLAWLNFVLPHVAFVKGCLLEVENEMTHIATVYRDTTRRKEEHSRRADKTPKEEVEDQISLDPRYIELKQFEQELLQERYLLDAQSEILERTLRVISRHVEVKKLDLEMNRTGANIVQRGRFNRPTTNGGY